MFSYPFQVLLLQVSEPLHYVLAFTAKIYELAGQLKEQNTLCRTPIMLSGLIADISAPKIAAIILF